MRLRAGLAAFLFAGFAFGAAEAPKPFRLHLPTEPTTFNPQVSRTTATSSYLLYSLHRSLYRVEGNGHLVPDLARKCDWSKDGLKLTCELRKNLKWSDGTALTSEDFLRSYFRILDPAKTSPRADLLFPLKNAQARFENQKTDKDVGVRADGPTKLIYEFTKKDPDFLWTLSTYILSPIPKDASADLMSGPFSGPYKLKTYDKGRRILLTPNSYYEGVSPRPSSQPDVEFAFIAEDNTALNLYIKNELDFLRRLPTEYIPKYRKDPEFHSLPVTRFDYLGFGPRLRENQGVRKALSLSLNYPELQSIFSSEGTPGCAGAPAEWFAQDRIPCLVYDLAAAQKEKIPDALKNLTYMFSSLGGDDHRRGAEWQQAQWRDHIGVNVASVPVENKVFLARIKSDAPDMFRKGLAPDRLTCLAVMETFVEGHPENYARYASQEFKALVEKLREAKTDKDRRARCSAAVKKLLDDYAVIPLGAWNFAILAKKNYRGWELNPLNQLDLSRLELKH